MRWAMRTNANAAAQNIKFYKDIGGLLVCKGICIRFRENLKYILTKIRLMYRKNKIKLLDKIRVRYGIAIVQIEDINYMQFSSRQHLILHEKNPFN